MIKQIYDKNEKEKITKKVLSDLTEWFGIPEYTQDYIKQSSQMIFFAAYHNDLSVGFISLKPTSEYTAEIYCMGVMKQYHRCGYGKELLEKFESYAKLNGFKLLQVKTVENGRYEVYNKTNSFYKAMGFYELEVFPNIWDEWNPCQVYVKPIA